MKKLLTTLLMIALVLTTMLSLTACSISNSTYGSLKKAFENEGYEEIEEIEDIMVSLKDQLEKDDLAVTLHGMSKLSLIPNIVYIYEFKSIEGLQKALQDSNTFRGLVKDVQEIEEINAYIKALEDEGYVKGNCFVISAPFSVTDIVKNA